jgi:hypothetical protein
VESFEAGEKVKLQPKRKQEYQERFRSDYANFCWDKNISKPRTVPQKMSRVKEYTRIYLVSQESKEPTEDRKYILE